MKTLGICFLILLNALFFSTPVSAIDNPNIIKKRIIDELMKSEVNDSKVALLINSIQEDGGWPGIDYEDVSRTGFQHYTHVGNLVLLARAYKKKNSKFYKSKEVKKTVERALKNWVDNDYICDNWWHNQIGVPNHMVSLMLIMGNDLADDLVKKTQPIIGRANINAKGARPSGDRIKIAGIQAKNALFLNDTKTFGEVIHVIESEIKFVEWIGMTFGYRFRLNIGGFENRSAGGRGIQYDNSFHHRTDGVNNTLSYGLGYADAFVEWAVYTSGTTYSFSDKKSRQLIDYFLDGICKTAIYGKYPDPGAKNRSFSRKGTLHAYSAKTAEKLLLTSDYRKDEIQEIIAIRNKGIKPTRSHATFYWQSEHFTFQRPEFFTSVRMYSTRTNNMEYPYNSEGLLNHHRGDGANHISRTGDEYYDIAPVFDYQKIPGATILQKPKLPSAKEIRKLGPTDFVGAVTDGIYGAVAFDFKSLPDSLVARKSWFFFDREYVCLGAGISTRKKRTVATTLNQCLLRDDVVAMMNNKKTVLKKGEHTLKNVQWLFHDGIGYLFPKSDSLKLNNTTVSGNWYTINKQTTTSKEEVNLEVFKLWLNHGEQPSDASYEYIVVPATSVKKLEEGDSKKNITILSNTPEIQAVKNNELHITQIVFYKAGELKISDGLILKIDSPGIIMIKTENNQLTAITASDPNRELNKIHISVSSRIEKTGDNFNAIWNKKNKMSNIAIQLPQKNYAGESVTIHLN
ncbi:MAG: polysaccharide lyase family 8 super-sandwich domain-containing protein [Flavobacteriaceae bacterium]